MNAYTSHVAMLMFMSNQDIMCYLNISASAITMITSSMILPTRCIFLDPKGDVKLNKSYLYHCVFRLKPMSWMKRENRVMNVHYILIVQMEFWFFTSIQSLMCPSNWVHYGLKIVFICLHITLFHYYHYPNPFERIAWRTKPLKISKPCVQQQQNNYLDYHGKGTINPYNHYIHCSQIPMRYLFVTLFTHLSSYRNVRMSYHK